jgi:hypothetical protein
MKKWFQKPPKLKFKSRCDEKNLLTKIVKISPPQKKHATWGMDHSSRSKGVSYICAKNHRKRKKKKKVVTDNPF